MPTHLACVVIRRVLLALAAVVVAGIVGGAASSAPGRLTASPPSSSKLKLLQFNVREGATGGRAAGVAAVIRASGADVVTLEEVTVKSIFEQIAAAVGFHSFYVPGVAGYSVGILSRFPLRRCFGYNQAPLQRAAYGCRIPIAGTNWWVFGAHLGSGSNEVARSKEAAFLLAQMNQHKTGPIVLAGDLNFQTPGENDRTPLLVVPMLKQSGYVDSYRQLYPSIQQNSGLTITAPPYGTWERRIDYVFHNPKVRATSARVISSVQGFAWPSDHAALAVTLARRSGLPIDTARASSSAPQLHAGRASASACRSDPHEGVHDPTRLTILSACVQVVGTVAKVPKLPPDGDQTFNVKLDPAYVGMMDAKNVADGGIHVEIVPMDQPGCTPGQPITKPAGYNNLGVCSGANVATPPVGARVRITGPYVHDDWAGKTEIHPAWEVEILPPDAPPVTTTTAPVTTTTQTPSAPKPLVLKARLVGRAVVGPSGAPHGTAAAVLTITPPKLCWRFTGVRNVGTPTRVRISRGSAGHNGHQLVALGKTYKARGCMTADVDNVLEPIGERPAQYYVTITSKTFPAGAVRGQLAKVQP